MKVNFLIVGAPKCGTTALWRYLGQHPDIFMSPRKDIHFFGSDLDFTKRDRYSPQEYASFFSDCTQTAVGEASVWYLYSKTAAKEIAQYNPNMKIIIMVRDPVQLMYAHYTQLRLNGLGDEDIPTFKQALQAEPERQKGLRIPKHNSIPSTLLYTQVASLSEQIERYKAHFPKEQIHIIFQEDMKHNMPDIYSQTLSFLGVSPEFDTDFSRINRHKEIRFEGLRTFIGAIPKPIKKRLPTQARDRFRKIIRNFNTRHAQRKPLEPALEDHLRKEFSKEISQLEQILNRDLTHWKAKVI